MLELKLKAIAKPQPVKQSFRDTLIKGIGIGNQLNKET